MRRPFGIVITLAAVVSLFVVGTASAAGPNPAKEQEDTDQAQRTTVAVAIGQLQEADGETATIDLRAGARDGRVGGTLRFYSPEEGYYNGAVRTLKVENGAIKASGGGGLFRPDGTRTQVRFTFDSSADGQTVTIVVRGRGGLEYEMTGRLDPGLVRAGTPSEVAAGAR